MPILDNSRWMLRSYFILSALYWRGRGITLPLSLPLASLPKIHQRVRVTGPHEMTLGSRATLFPYTYLKSVGGSIAIGERSSIGEYTYINSAQRVVIAGTC
jgi:hypothetical protein